MIKAVFWDFGGVITTSPFESFNRFEASNEERMIEIKNMIMDKLFQFGELKFEEG